MSDLHASLLEEKKRRDELEELKRQRQEDEQLDTECVLIDKEARDAPQRQQEAQRKRETIVRQVAMNRCIRIKEQELEAAQLVSSFIRENLSDDHPAVASAPISSSLQDIAAAASVYELPPSRIFTPAPANMRYAESQSDSTPPLSQIGYPCTPQPSGPQSRPMPQPLQQTLAPVQASTSTVQTLLSSIPPVPAHATPSLSTHHVPVTLSMVQDPWQSASMHVPVTLGRVQAPDQSASMLGPVQPTFTGSLPPMPMQTMSSQSPYNTLVQPHTVMDLVMASAYGIPKPSLPVYKSGQESDFALFKLALDNLLDNHPHLTEQYKYKILLEHLQHPGAHKLARSCMHDVKTIFHCPPSAAGEVWSAKAVSTE